MTDDTLTHIRAILAETFYDGSDTADHYNGLRDIRDLLLATPASAPVGETTDGQRLFWLGMHLAGTKWADALESLRPRDAEGDYTEKYIGGPDSLRAAIDAARAAERRDQEEGR